MKEVSGGLGLKLDLIAEAFELADGLTFERFAVAFLHVAQAEILVARMAGEP